MRLIALVLAGCLLAPSLSCQGQSHSVSLKSLSQLDAYVGTFPCSNGLLEAPALRHPVMMVVGADSSDYAEHLRLSGCGEVERDGQLLVMDVSQLHVGGYASLIFVRPREGAIWVFWLNEMVAINAPSRVYGARPVPTEVLAGVERRMNEGWGHVAHFRADGDSMIIERKP